MEPSAPLADLIAEPAAFAAHPDAAVRRLAVAGLGARHGPVLRKLLAGDPAGEVRAAAAEAMGLVGVGAVEPLLAATHDGDATVVEAAVTALGELGDSRAVERLLDLAVNAGDRLVQEAAAAALGAIGDPKALPRLLELASSGPPQVRRRCVAALTVFDGPEVEAAILAARADRNPMVREAAEMVLGREVPELACSPLLNLQLPPVSSQG